MSEIQENVIKKTNQGNQKMRCDICGERTHEDVNATYRGMKIRACLDCLPKAKKPNFLLRLLDYFSGETKK